MRYCFLETGNTNDAYTCVKFKAEIKLISASGVAGRRGNVDFKGMHISMGISKVKMSLILVS